MKLTSVLLKPALSRVMFRNAGVFLLVVSFVRIVDFYFVVNVVLSIELLYRIAHPSVSITIAVIGGIAGIAAVLSECSIPRELRGGEYVFKSVRFLRLRYFWSPMRETTSNNIGAIAASERRQVCAFTLVEMLAVITVVALLASLVLAAISSAKRQAKSTICANNIRQLVLAWNIYTTDDDRRLVPNADGLDNSPVAFTWVAGSMSIPEQATNRAILTDSQVSLLGPYVQTATIFKCPSDRSSFVRSIAMNNRMNPVRISGEPGWLLGAGTAFSVFRRIEQIRSPSEIFVMIEERHDSINDAYFVTDMSNTGNADGRGTANPYFIVDYPAAYHDGNGNLAFADGHVEMHKWLERTTSVPIGKVRPRSHTSSTDRDVIWLQTHCTSAK